MAYCPVCKVNWDDTMSECPVCSHELGNAPADAEAGSWILLGSVGDKISADYAKEVLSSYEIPVVVISKSGFFGQAGLTLHTFYKPGSLLFEVSVPAEWVEEATEIMEMILGDKWQRKE